MIAAALAAAAVASTPVGVAEREFRISLYRAAVPAGEVRFNVTNFGEDTHNLVVRGVASDDIRAGKRGTLVVRLRPGTYRVICSLGDHEARGMRAKLRVTRRRR